ncbi:diacylglycerol kinase, partial [bacterium]|nr:diacylglycerol kinase [bacterium]
MPGLGIISNPFAKINKRDPEHNTLLWYILGNRGQFEITNSLADLGRVCEEFCARGLDTVGIVGGDGTI